MPTTTCCKSCTHFKVKSLKCRRFPVEVKKSSDDLCGEYKIARK